MNNNTPSRGGASPFHQIEKLNQRALYQLCPKHSSCSAPICPLDKGNHQRCYLKDERICVWVRETVKPHGEANLRGAIPSLVADLVLSHTFTNKLGNTTYSKQLERYVQTPSKLFKG